MGCEGSRTSAWSVAVGGCLQPEKATGYISGGDKSTVIGILDVFVCEGTEEARRQNAPPYLSEECISEA